MLSINELGTNRDERKEGRSKPKVGRKPVKIDLTDVEKLAALHCTHQEMADWFGVSLRTIASRLKRREFAEAMQRGRARAHISLRRCQMKIVEGGSSAMAIWMGKQFLGQRETVTTEHVGTGGGPIQLSVKPDLSKLTDKELEQLRELTHKTLPTAA
jgi:hypothetical protein